MTESRYRTVIDEAYLAEKAHGIRWRKTFSFLEHSALAGTAFSVGLDLGERTPLTGMLEELFGAPFTNTQVDLDLERLEGEYKVVTAFEVLEHLYNPLHALLEVKGVLRGEGARLFVSMPLHKPEFLASPDHFHEMSGAAAHALFQRAGFRVVRKGEFRIRQPWFYCRGVKPLLRAWYVKVQIYELAVQQ